MYIISPNALPVVFGSGVNLSFRAAALHSSRSVSSDIVVPFLIAAAITFPFLSTVISTIIRPSWFPMYVGRWNVPLRSRPASDHEFPPCVPFPSGFPGVFPCAPPPTPVPVLLLPPCPNAPEASALAFAACSARCCSSFRCCSSRMASCCIFICCCRSCSSLCCCSFLFCSAAIAMEGSSCTSRSGAGLL